MGLHRRRVEALFANELKQSPAENGAPAHKAARRFRSRWLHSNAAAAAGLAVASSIAFFTTWYLLSPGVEHASRTFLTAMVFANLFIAAGFAGLVGYRVWHAWSDRRHQLAGSQTHLHLVGMFAIVAVLPSIIAFLFAFTILRTSLNDVFSDRIERYHNTARDLANGLVEMKAGQLEFVMRQIAFDIRRNEEAGLGLEATPISFRQYLFAQAQLRGLSALYVIGGDGRILVRAEVREGAYNLPSRKSFENLKAGSDPGELFTFGVNDEQRLDVFRGALSIPYYGGGYLVAYEPVDPVTTKRLFAVNAQRSDWREAERGRSRAESVFTLGYFFLAIIILSGAILLALWAATRIVRPIGRLVGMADRVSSGDLSARVEVYKGDGELGALARSMNRMTGQLQTQRDDLIETNKQFDRRRRFTEAVLSGVSAGVIGVSSHGRITIANRFAADLLNEDGQRLAGAAMAEIIPELRELMSEARQSSSGEAAAQVEFERGGRPRTINVRIVSDESEGERSFVVTFDDITQLISAQRNAAWGDVARRIAHEIKNPLTPIQLSAERLRRKYLNEITSSPDIFDKCTETIIRHVRDIGRMVDEFSSFARMPKPVFSREDARDLARAAIFPQRVAFPDIEFTVGAPDEPVFIECDERLLVQALGNLLKNAGESVSARTAEAGESPANGRIHLSVSTIGGQAHIAVIDNGLGLPKAERHRLTEPYMTTREKGTGLGLAIVRKVVEEHGGVLKFEDDTTLGPIGARISMIVPLARAGHAEAAAEATAAE
jgi:two-component system nitrogen regulation sensor histidine kinase NtrY